MELNTLQNLHILLVALFTIHYLVKGALLLGSSPSLDTYRKKTMVPEMILATLFIITGVWMLSMLGMDWLRANGWFHMKLTLVLLSIPIGMIGYKRGNKLLALAASAIYVFVFWLAWTHGS
jgi:uncharacterized membrane protein SirB2